MGIQNFLSMIELVDLIHGCYEKAYTDYGLAENDKTKTLMENVYKRTWAHLQEHEDIQQRLTRLG